MKKLFKKVNVWLIEGYSVLTYFIPNVVKWIFRKYYLKEITTFYLEYSDKDNLKRAYLYLHGDLKSNNNKTPILFFHGDYSHPITMLSLVDTAQNVGNYPIFSVYLPYDDLNPEIHQSLVNLALNKIQKLMRMENHETKGIIAVGHSRGAIEAAHQAFVEKNTMFKAVITIAGRLRDIPSKTKSCSEALKPIIHKIYHAIVENPLIPLYQIIPEKDWNAPLEAMAVRAKGEVCCIVEEALHFNILFKEKTHHKLRDLLKKF